MIKYKAWGGTWIDKVDVEVKGHLVEVRGELGGREQLETKNHKYCDTFDEAKLWLVQQAKSQVAAAEELLEFRKKQLDKVYALKEQS